jgi:CBS domain-containing protein
MKVKDVMNPIVKACRPSDNLAWAAELMWENDCGVLPVVGEGGQVVGLITDRDICMAAAMTHENLANLAVESVISGDVFGCAVEDDIRSALTIMQEKRVRRLPVLAADGTLAGILSMNDLVLQAQPATGKDVGRLSYGDIVHTYQAICAHPLPATALNAGAGA